MCPELADWQGISIRCANNYDDGYNQHTIHGFDVREAYGLI